MMPVIEEALRDARVPSRAAAVRALRLAPGPEIDALIANVIASDHDPAVRADAIFAARFRRPLPASIADAVVHAAERDSTDYVRSDAVVLLRQFAASPDISDVLAHIANRDSNSAIRREAREAMANAFASNTR